MFSLSHRFSVHKTFATHRNMETIRIRHSAITTIKGEDLDTWGSSLSIFASSELSKTGGKGKVRLGPQVGEMLLRRQARLRHMLEGSQTFVGMG